jgi:hypothetical protein
MVTLLFGKSSAEIYSAYGKIALCFAVMVSEGPAEAAPAI